MPQQELRPVIHVKLVVTLQKGQELALNAKPPSFLLLVLLSA